ncbi:MAG: ABC-2 transporter permease [Pseudomonadota bacterium]
MNTTTYPSVVRALIRKDLAIMKIPALCYWLAGLGAIVMVMTFGDASGTVAFILFVSALVATGVHAAMQTVTEERRSQNLPFIMSLPITIGDYTLAKMVANLLLGGGIWLFLSAASYVIYIGDSVPHGRVPYMTILLVQILLAYIVILTTTIVFASLVAAISAIVAANLGSQVILWWIVGLHGVRSTINGPEVVWNATYLTVLGLQLAAIVGLIGFTFYAQSRKTQFI